MKLVRGKVVGGKVVVEGEPLEEGSAVSILAREDGELFELGPQDEADLLRSIQEGESGDSVDGDEFLRNLSRSK